MRYKLKTEELEKTLLEKTQSQGTIRVFIAVPEEGVGHQVHEGVVVK